MEKSHQGSKSILCKNFAIFYWTRTVQWLEGDLFKDWKIGQIRQNWPFDPTTAQCSKGGTKVDFKEWVFYIYISSNLTERINLNMLLYNSSKIIDYHSFWSTKRQILQPTLSQNQYQNMFSPPFMTKQAKAQWSHYREA